MKKVIGISGNNGAGKDTFGMMLQAAYERKGIKVQRVAIADAMYLVTRILFNIPTKKECDLTPALKEELRPDGYTPRRLLIGIGASMRQIDKEVWVKIVLKKHEEFDGLTIITDIRFENEKDICDEVFQIHREGHDQNVGWQYGEVILNNGSLDDLQKEAEKWIA